MKIVESARDLCSVWNLRKVGEKKRKEKKGNWEKNEGKIGGKWYGAQ